MWQIYRLLEAFVQKEISAAFFTHEIYLIWCRYGKELTKLEKERFHISLSEYELGELYHKLGDICVRYYDGVCDEEIEKYGYTSLIELRTVSSSIYQEIKEKELIKFETYI